ncbi:MAG: glycoside hydrolase family 140 protein [Acidobacteria bacterium]|nr:glycoside hydrolase family 140 protein [Acidobacteriota bacterium]MCI0722352.1 glycoside hydrolase family 140 protein [Acidobacteriota bacterium]
MKTRSSIFTLALLLAMRVGADFVQAQSASSFPVRVSSDGRYLVDAEGKPFMIHGDSGWSIIAQLTKEDAEFYLEDRRQKGFNTIIALLIDNEFADNAPKNAYSDGPFTAPADFSTPNEAYFAHADWVLNKAAEKGILVLVCPAFAGHDDKGGWGAQVVNNGATKSRSYGKYLGNWYQNFKNVIWVHWGDRTPAPGSTLEKNSLEVLLGIKETAPAHLHTAHMKRTHTAREVAAFKPFMDLDAVYSAFRPYVACLRRYRVSDFKPTFLWEAYYEGPWMKRWPVGTPSSQRRQAYWTMTSGATGHLYGNNAIWGFGYKDRRHGTHPDNYTWKDDLNDPGTLDMAHLKSLLSGRPWHNLIPDDNHTIVTGGRGTKDTVDRPIDAFDAPPRPGGQSTKDALDHKRSTGSDYVTAARTDDGKLVIVYVPPTGTSARTITVDMSKLSGPATAQWFNPNTGEYTTISGSPLANSGSKDFTTPGSNGDDTNDWVLVLESHNPGATPAQKSATPGTVLSAGSLATPWHPGFDVVAEPARKIIHFIGTESRRLRYMKSTDGGLTWSSPEDLGVGWAARMATDSKGNVHLVYGTDPRQDPADPPKTDASARVGWYRVRSSEGWSAPVALRAPAMDFPGASVVTLWISDGHRIAVDGNDNAHVTYWAWPENFKTVPWEELQRLIYLRKPAGAASFEPVHMLRHGKDEKGGGAIADPVVDPNGDVHLIYGSWNGSEWRTTHVVRKKDGSWGEKIHDWISMTAEYSMKTAIGPDGLIHVAGFDEKTLSWIYCN